MKPYKTPPPQTPGKFIHKCGCMYQRSASRCDDWNARLICVWDRGQDKGNKEVERGRDGSRREREREALEMGVWQEGERGWRMERWKRSKEWKRGQGRGKKRGIRNNNESSLLLSAVLLSVLSSSAYKARNSGYAKWAISLSLSLSRFLSLM